MKLKVFSAAVAVVLLGLGILWFPFTQADQSDASRQPNFSEKAAVQASAAPTQPSASETDQRGPLSDPLADLSRWRTELTAPVGFAETPQADNEGIIYVANPLFRYAGHELRLNNEDAPFYKLALKGGRGALLLGRRPGRPPCALTLGELFLENGKLEFKERLLIGSTKSAMSTFLVDTRSRGNLNRIGVAITERTEFLGGHYPAIIAVTEGTEGITVSPQEVESLPLVPIQPYWATLGYDGELRDVGNRVKVVWFEFKGKSAELVRVSD